MAAPTFLTDEYIYRVAPDGKSTQAGLQLVQRGAFSAAKQSADGTRLEARCQGSEPKPYQVQVNLSDAKRPQTSCNCFSYKRPCKHAIGLMFLAAHSPDVFAQQGEQGPGQAKRRPADTIEHMAAPRAAATKTKRARPKDMRQALLDAVLAEPEQEAPRLIYADWLEEHGELDEQPRAEFIRVQCELARMDEKGPRRKALREREKQLWETHREAWIKHLPAHLRKKNVRFHRGFLEELNLAPRSWGSHGAKLFAENPIYRVRLTGTVDRHEVGDLVVIPHLAKIRELSLAGCTLHEPIKTLQILFSTPFLSGLTRLVLSGCSLGSQHLAVLVESPVLGRLRELDLSDNEIGPKGVQSLVESAAAVKLRTLLLRHNPIGDAGAKALAGSPHLAKLERLDLTGVALGEAAVDALRQRFGKRVLLD
jgi:uncharacterized protein (TIGR02996 family)